MKAELHSHCSLDPSDHRICEMTPEALISNASKLGYEILAITCHNLDVWTQDLSDYAASLGMTLIPGMEVTAERTRHTLVYNFRADALDLQTLDKIRSRSREDTLVIAPHPYFPGPVSLGDLLEKNIEVFDAIELSGFYTQHIDFNRRAEALAARTHKPLVGNGDVHYSWQLGRTFTWIYAEPGILPVLRAVKEGLVRPQRSPLTFFEAANWWAKALWRNAFAVGAEKPSDKIENGRGLRAAQQSVKS